MFFPAILYCSPVTQASLLKKDIKTLRRGLAIITDVSYVPPNELCIKLWHASIGVRKMCTKFFRICSHTRIRSVFRSIHSRLNIYRNSTVRCLTRILTNRELIMTGFLTISREFQMSISHYAFFQICILMRWLADPFWLKWGHLCTQKSKHHHAIQRQTWFHCERSAAFEPTFVKICQANVFPADASWIMGKSWSCSQIAKTSLWWMSCVQLHR